MNVDCRKPRNLDWLHRIAPKGWIEGSYIPARRRLLWELEQQHVATQHQPFLRQHRRLQSVLGELAEIQRTLRELYTLQEKEKELVHQSNELIQAERDGVVLGELGSFVGNLSSGRLCRCPQPGCLGVVRVSDNLMKPWAECTVCGVQLCPECHVVVPGNPGRAAPPESHHDPTISATPSPWNPSKHSWKRPGRVPGASCGSKNPRGVQPCGASSAGRGSTGIARGR